ncbi:MAG: HAD family phosphatase [Spirochaetales bacterium]|nr:HAD family phosphatase [Spirochaetales bacterium]
MIETVIFDMDGVLIDSEPIHQRVNQAFFNKLGTPVTMDFYQKNFIGLPVEQMLIYLKKEYSLSETVPSMLAECGRLLFEDFERSELVPAAGAKELLASLKEQGYNLAVGSSSSSELIRLIVRKLGLESYFDHLVSGYEVERGKPHPDLFLKIAGIFGSEPSRCAVIEDSSLGLEAAWNAGMKAVGVNNPASNQNMARAAVTVTGFAPEERALIEESIRSW